MLTAALACVQEFHRGIGAPVASTPTLLDGDRHDLEAVARGLADLCVACERASRTPGDLLARLALSIEELCEFVQAHLDQDLTAMMDAVGDRLYVLLGDAAATGTPLEAVFREVHRSNMTKVGSGTTSLGKARKAGDYSSPELHELLP